MKFTEAFMVLVKLRGDDVDIDRFSKVCIAPATVNCFSSMQHFAVLYVVFLDAPLTACALL